MALLDIGWIWWVIGLASVAVLLVTAAALVVWIRMVIWRRSFTAVTCGWIPRSPRQVWDAVIDPGPSSGVDASERGASAEPSSAPWTPSLIVDAFEWLIGDDPSGVVPSSGARVVWQVLEDARPGSVVLSYAADAAGLHGIVEIQLETPDADPASRPIDDPDDEAAADDPGAADLDVDYPRTRVVVIHHCDPAWREGAAIARRPEREHAYGDALLRRLASALDAQEPEDLAYLGVSGTRGPVAP